jgi:ABC-2 type transport system permease protein
VTDRRAIFLSARREIRERLRSRAFLISTGIQVAVVVAIVVIAAVTGGDDADKFDVGYVGAESRAVVESARAQQAGFDAEVTPREFSDEAAARAAVDGDDVDAAVAGESIYARPAPSEVLVSMLQSASGDVRGEASLRSEGLSQARIRAALDPPPLTVAEVGDDSAGGGIAFVGSLLLYIALLSFGIVVSTAVVEEKSTRVVEVVLSAIRPIQLLSGKVLGIGLTGICQVLVIAGVGVGAAFATGSIDMPDSTAEVVVLVVVYFLLGYALYAAGFAVAGALVSRQEDVQSASAPLTILLVAAYLAAISLIETPDSTLAVVCTLLPPVAPMVVPGRAAQGELPAGELVLSLVLMVVAAAILLWIAARIYDRAVLRMGAPIKLREALRLAR